jgi:hypothetical protein
MLNLVEKVVKEYVKKGLILKYIVTAHWDQTPQVTRKNYGLLQLDQGGSLIWGEQFAPTRLSWEVFQLNVCPTTNVILSTPLLTGSNWYPDTSQWNNHFPDIKD